MRQEVENLRSILSSAIPDPGSPGHRLFGEEWARVSEAALTGTLTAIISQAFEDKDSVHAKDIKCIRATLFDKTAEANWKVPWHQDLTIPIEEVPPRDVVEGLTAKGFGPWTAAFGIRHV